MQKPKIGVVSYLNVLPITYKLQGYDIVKGSPYELSKLYQEKKLSAALLPVYEVLNNNSFIVDTISISSSKEAASVLCFLNKDIGDVKKVGLDKSSLSSMHLLKLILKNYYYLDCEYFILDSKELVESKDRFDAYLLIGDNAIYHSKLCTSFIDLGFIWNKWTGYPFVFALWASNKKDMPLKKELVRAKEEGLGNIDNIIKKADYADKAFLHSYYKKYLSFNLGDREKAAIKLYQGMLYDMDFCTSWREIVYY